VSTGAQRLRFVTIGLGLLLVALAGYAAWLLVSPIDLPWQRVDSSFDAAAAVDGQRLTVSGLTNLPDGSVVDYYFWREPMDDSLPDGGHAVVADGAFRFAADLSGWPPGPAHAEITFGCNWGTEQPTHVTDLLGGSCEHLAGERVYVDSPGDPKQLLVTVDFKVP
jgi:hypothetical protein